MEKLQIKRIDLLAHPFYVNPFGEAPDKYSEKEAGFLLQLWKEHVDEAVKDSSRLLFILRELGSGQGNKQRSALSNKLINYAKNKLHGRFGLIEEWWEKFEKIWFYDCRGQRFENFNRFSKKNNIVVDPQTVKTRGLGECTTGCIFYYLTKLNGQIGLSNPIPYRNKQSTLLPRKSIAQKGEYPFPWELKELRKTVEGRNVIREKMKKYIIEKRAAIHALPHYGKKHIFEPRTRLMKKKPRA